MKRRTFLQTTTVLAAGFSVPSFAQSANASKVPALDALMHRVTDTKAPIVYFSPKVSEESLLSVYTALKQSIRGQVGIKMTFETPGGPHLDPKLVKALADHTKGTLIDNNCYSPRDTTAKHLEVARPTVLMKASLPSTFLTLTDTWICPLKTATT